MVKQKKSSKVKVICLLIIAFLLVGGYYFGSAYINDYYHANKTARAALKNDSDIKISYPEKDVVVFEPEEIKAGLIFYPGGKVEYTAYAPLLRTFAEAGYMCVLLHMPANLAVFDINAADKVLEKYPDIDEWYIGGHSLGGSMAAQYVSKNADKFKGLMLFASFSTEDLSDTDLEVYSVYGSNDKVLSIERYEECKKNLPEKLYEKRIEGGCHSYFGNYGMQNKDGKPTITAKEQIETTVDFIVNCK